MNDTIYTEMTDTLQGITDTLTSPTTASIPITYSHVLEPIFRIDNLSNNLYIGLLLWIMVIVSLTLLARNRNPYQFILRNFFTVRNRTIDYDSEHSGSWANVLLWIIVMINYALIILIAASLTTDTILLKDATLLGLTVIGILISFLLHFLIFKLMGYVFIQYAKCEAYLKSYFTVVFLLGILFLPLSICFVYLPITSYHVLFIIGYLLVIIAFILLFMKALQLFYQKIVSIFYIFLYFCTLEILPILLIKKVLFSLL